VKYLAAILLSGLLAVQGILIVATYATLPPRVATHFDFAGHANGFMMRADYLILMTAIGLGVPLLLLFATVLLPYLAPTRLRIPSPDYWTAPERRSQTLSTIAAVGLFMSAVVTAFIIAMQLLLVEANARTPPRMDIDLLFAFVAVLIVAILFSQFFMWRRFRVPQ
jgi:serine/threonine-protein kinase